MQILLDTDYLIDVERGRAELPRVQVLISWITLYEFIRGRSDYAEAKARLEKALTVAYPTNEVLLKAAEMYRDLRKRGELVDERDLLIAATAIALGVPLKTRNTAHYQRLTRYGLKLL
jgi:predicted nucleic acid-binding protein